MKVIFYFKVDFEEIEMFKLQFILLILCDDDSETYE